MADTDMDGPACSYLFPHLLTEPATKRACGPTVLRLTAMFAGAGNERRHGDVWTEHADHLDSGTVALREKIRDEERGIGGRLTVARDEQTLETKGRS